MGTKEDRRTVLVAGGAGFIGSHLCDALIRDGARVFCLDNYLTGSRENLRHWKGDPRLAMFEGDVIDGLPAAWSTVRFSHVYNLACAGSPSRYQADPEHTMLTNVLGTRNLLRLAQAHGARFLLASTSEVYGDPEVHPQPESYAGRVNCNGPRACYDEGKRAAEALAYDFQRQAGVDVRVARIFNTYGPRMRVDDGRAVPNMIVQALRGGAVTIYGDGSQTRSFCYVADTVAGLIRLMDSRVADGPVNIGNPAEMRIGELAGRVVSLIGRKADMVHLPLPPDDPRRRSPDIGRARRLLGWEPVTPLDEGLAATAAWLAAELRTQRPAPSKPPAVEAAE